MIFDLKYLPYSSSYSMNIFKGANDLQARFIHLFGLLLPTTNMFK